MKITVEILGWTDRCTGCNREIKPIEKVFMFSGLAGVAGSLHFCKECIDKIAECEVKNDN